MLQDFLGLRILWRGQCKADRAGVVEYDYKTGVFGIKDSMEVEAALRPAGSALEPIFVQLYKVTSNLRRNEGRELLDRDTSMVISSA